MDNTETAAQLDLDKLPLYFNREYYRVADVAAAITQARTQPAAAPIALSVNSGEGAPSVKTWQERLEAAHPEYDPAYWTFLLMLKYALVEIVEMRTALAAAPAAPHAQAEPVALTVWYGSLPESNGKSNYTALLMRKGASIFDSAEFTIDVSEYPDRVRYEADRVRFIIGELAERPDILAYDADKHSGYAAPAPQEAEQSDDRAWDSFIALGRDNFHKAIAPQEAEQASASPAGDKPRIPTEEMLNAARDWSVKKYGIGIGNDAAIGCWQSMYDTPTTTKG